MWGSRHVSKEGTRIAHAISGELFPNAMFIIRAGNQDATDIPRITAIVVFPRFLDNLPFVFPARGYCCVMR